MARNFTAATPHYIEFSNSSLYDFTATASFTIYLWCAPTTASYAAEVFLFAKDGNGAFASPYPFSLRLNGDLANDPYRLYRYDGTNAPFVGVNSPVGVTAGQWVFVMAGRDAAQANELFITCQVKGGILPALTRANDTATGTTNNGLVARAGWWTSGAGYYDGKLADLAICNAAHTLAQGQAVMEGGVPLNAVLGSRFCGNTSPEPDWTGNGLHGTVGGATRSIPHPTYACENVPAYRPPTFPILTPGFGRVRFYKQSVWYATAVAVEAPPSQGTHQLVNAGPVNRGSVNDGLVDH